MISEDLASHTAALLDCEDILYKQVALRISELIEHNSTGFLIESLETQIAELQGRPDLLASVAARARQAWRERFTLAEYQRRILSIVETAGASARR